MNVHALIFTFLQSHFYLKSLNKLSRTYYVIDQTQPEIEVKWNEKLCIFRSSFLVIIRVDTESYFTVSSQL